MKKAALRPTTLHLLLLALAVASVLRFWKLDSLPPGLYHDEAYNGLDALSLTRGKSFPLFYEGWELYAQDAHAGRPSQPTRFPVFFEGNYGREPLHIYLMALAIKVFGATPIAIRIVPAAAGVLAVLTTYLAGQALLESEGSRIENRTSRRIAGSGPVTGSYAPILAAFVLAALYPAVHFSRFGIRAMLFVPIETMTVYCFWRGISVAGGRRSVLNSEWWFAAAGALLGIGLYTYAAARLFPLLFVCFTLIWFWRDRSEFRRFWRSIVMMAVASLVVAMPLLIFFLRFPYYFVFRIAYVANKGLGTVEDRPWLTWINNIGRVIRGLFWWGETHLRHNLPGRPFLDPIQAVLFAAGSSLGLRRWRQPERQFLLLWLFVMLLPSILSGDAPHFGRLSGAAPAIALLVGFGADWLRSKVTPWQFADGNRPISGSRIWSRVIGIALVPVLLVTSTTLTARDYFLRYARHPDVPTDFYLPDWQLGQYAAAQPADASLYLTPTQAEMATIFFALADPDRLRSYDGSAGLIPAGPAAFPSLYLVGVKDEASLNFLTTYFPDGKAKTPVAGHVPFYVPPQAVRPSLPNKADFSWGGKIKLVGWSQQLSDGQLVVTLAWTPESHFEANYTAYVHLLSEDDELITQLDRPPAGYPTGNWRPGEIIVDHYALALPSTLPPGRYRIRSGWYLFPSLEELGEPAPLSDLVILD